MAIAIRPTAEMQSIAEGTAARDALVREPDAVGAYDHVPFASAAAVFTMDTASEVFMLHSAQVTICCVAWIQIYSFLQI